MGIKLIQTKRIHEGWLQLDIHKLKYPNGHEQEYHTINFRDSEGGTAIIGITEDNKIILTQQYRYPLKKEILEIPMGGISKNETPENAAKREMQEETGYTAKNAKVIGEKYLMQNLTNHKITYVLLTELTKGKTNFDITENITTKHFDFEEALNKVINGEIQDNISSTGILLYDKIRKEKNKS